MPGQICTVPDAISSLADPLHELAEREHQAAVLVQERRHVGQFEGACCAMQAEQRAAARSASAQGARAAAGADRVEQVDHLLLPSPARPWESRPASRSGRVARMPRARVTTPETPKPISSARS